VSKATEKVAVPEPTRPKSNGNAQGDAPGSITGARPQLSRREALNAMIAALTKRYGEANWATYE
jgi:hypothetical protein